MPTTWFAMNRMIINDASLQGLVARRLRFEETCHYLTDEEHELSIDRYNKYLRGVKDGDAQSHTYPKD